MSTATPPAGPRAPSDADLHCGEDEGRRYREGVYRPLDDAALASCAPDDPAFPAPGHGPAFRRHDDVPRVPRLRNLMGPSVIALGMGLGAGEFLLWPNLITANGWGIWWLFWVGVLTQFVVIAEIERWTVATGESVFAGMGRLARGGFWPWLFLAATLVGFFWPGWASQSAEFIGQIGAEVTGTRLPWQPIALAMIVLIYLALAVTRVVYNVLERFEIALVVAFFPLLAVSLLVAGIVPEDALGLARGAVSLGTAPDTLLTGAQFPTLLVAVAYAGSGGTLLLAQSLWLRDKGFGMAAFQGRIAGLRGENEPISETGYAFDSRQPTALARFRAWMRVARTELWWTFVVLIVLSVVITTLLVASTVGVGRADLAGRLTEMVTLQADALERAGGAGLKIAFLTGGALVLFSTQVGIIDTVTRIAGTIFYERYGRRTAFWTMKRTFFFFLTAFSAAACAIVVLSWTGGEAVDALQPDFLVLIAGPVTIASMYLFALVVGTMNVRRLPAALRPGLPTRLGLLWAGVLWGWFTAEQVSRSVLDRTGAAPEVATALVPEPVRAVAYGAWLLSLVWFAWAVLGPSAWRERAP